MYAVVPLFCNKQLPMIQMCSTNIKDVLMFLQNNIKISLKQIYDDNDIEGTLSETSLSDEKITAKQYLKMIIDYVESFDFSDGVILRTFHKKNIKILSQEFFIDEKLCCDTISILVIKFENTIKNCWTEVLENNV